MERQENQKEASENVMTSQTSSGGAILRRSDNFGRNKYEISEPGLNNLTYNKAYMKIHPEGHIERWQSLSFERITQRLEVNSDGFLPENNTIVSKFIYDARIGKTIVGRQKKKVGLLRIVKYLHDLRMLDHYFKKPLDKLTQQELERFILDLEEGRIKTERGTPYRPETQIVIKKMIRKFYKWLFGNNINTPEIVQWIDTSGQMPEYQALKKEQIENILNLITSPTSRLLARNRAIIMVLFDAGLRADELINIRMKHLSFDKGDYHIRVEFSKTLKRTVTLPFCKQYLDSWLDVHPARTEPLAQLFPINYGNLLNLVSRAGKIINVRLTPHGLRHASATYWCQHLTPYELCYRFGWSMSSKMPQRYIDATGLYQEKASKVVKAAQTEVLQEENKIMALRLARMEEQMNKFFAKDKEEAKRIIELVLKDGTV